MKVNVGRRTGLHRNHLAIWFLCYVLLSFVSIPTLGSQGSALSQLALAEHAVTNSIQEQELSPVRVLVSDQDLQKHIADADLVIVGKVSEVRIPTEPRKRRPITEHDPQWREAVVEVEAVMKGSESLKKVVILFPGTLDVAWVGVPRFKVGQQGIWIVRKEPETEPEAYAVKDPLDFHPRNQLERVRQLIRK